MAKKSSHKRKVKTFFQTFKKSAFKPDYYREVLKAPFSFSLKYFLAFFLAINLVTALFIISFLAYQILPQANHLEEKIAKAYPEELTIEIKDGQASTTGSEPYFLPLNPDWFPSELAEGLKQQPIQNILVIDTQADPLEIKKYQTFFFLTKDSFVLTGDRGEIQVHSLENVGDFTLNQQVVKKAWQRIRPRLKWILPAAIIFLLLGFLLTTLGLKFFFVLITSLISWPLARITKLEKINYRQALQINLQAISLPTVISALFQFLGAPPKIPFFQGIILIIYNLIIFSSLREKAN